VFVATSLSGEVCGLISEGGHFVFAATFSRRGGVRSKRKSRNRGVVRGTAFVVREEKRKISCSGRSQTLPARPSGKGGWMQSRR
jgi:hypothetical protein